MVEYVCFKIEHDFHPSKFHAGLEVCRICRVTRPTTGAVDLGDSAALEVGQRPEVLSAGQGESTPAPNH